MKYLNGFVLITIICFSLIQGANNLTAENSHKETEDYENNVPAMSNDSELSDLEGSFIQKTSKKSKGSNTNKKAKNSKNSKNSKKSKKANKAKSKKAKVIKTQKLGKYVIKTIENPALKHKPKKLKKYVSYSHCNKKSGYLKFIQKRPSNSKREITVVPIFVSLNKFTFSLFRSFKSSSLFRLINLDSIQRVALQYDNTNCFDIIINDIKTKKLHSGPLSLCAPNMNEMKEWIRAILEFKECKIKGDSSSSVPHQGRTLVDFNKINNLIKQTNVASSVGQLVYDGTDTYVKDTPFKREQRKQISQTISKIMETIHMTKMAKNQLRRHFVGKFKNARGMTSGAHREQEMFQNIIQKRQFAEKEKFATLLKSENSNRTMKLLKTVQSKITKMSRKELKDYKNTLSTQIKLEKERAGKESKKLMRKILQQQKLTKYQVCYDKRLTSFNNQAYADKLCKRYYGDYGLKMCNQKENFCTMCCNFHIGTSFPLKRINCQTKCHQVLNPKGENLENKKKSKSIKDIKKSKSKNQKKSSISKKNKIKENKNNSNTKSKNKKANKI